MAKAKSTGGNGTIDEHKPLFDQVIGDLDVEKAFGIEFGRSKNLNVFCPWCENEETSQTPSCSVSREGMFHCKSCGRRGTAATFYSQKKRVPIRQAREEIGAPPVNPKKETKERPARPITDKLVKGLSDTLLRSSFDLQYLTGPKRGLKLETIKAYEIGKDESRFTLPIRFRDGSLHGLRRYLPRESNREKGTKKRPKMVSHAGGSGEPYLYPAQNLDEYTVSSRDYLILCEGEWDVLQLIQNGFDAITTTSGVQTWDHSWTIELLTVGKPIVIIYDVNDAPDELGRPNLGQRVAMRRAVELMEAGLTVKVVALPIPYTGGDVTDWFTRAGKTAEELRKVIDETPIFDGVVPDEESTSPSVVERTEEETPLVTLHEASLGKYYYKAIRLRCIVAGRAHSPYLLPKKVQIDVKVDGETAETITHNFDCWDGSVLSLIRCTTQQQYDRIKSLCGIEKGVECKVTILETWNVEEIYLIPAIEHDRDQGPYTMRQAYYVGHGLYTNQVYEFEAYTLPDPKTQTATHIITSAKLAATDLDNFELDDKLRAKLRKVFGTTDKVDVFKKLDIIAGQFASHITHIYGRSDLHIAIDLVFHSPLSFDFDGTRLKKGWLEALIIGDTRTGKGFVAEGLVRHFGVGEVVSAEDMTMAGLVGGIQKVGDQLMLTWGKIPLLDKRALVIDECSSLSYDHISKLSRIRSEGVVEITKIITEKTSARTRLLWLSNPRPVVVGKPKVMQDFTYGIQAVPELVGNAEDVARFDYVLTVRRGEVSSQVINKGKKDQEKNQTPLEFTSELCRKLIVWIWSRTPDQIVFDEGVVEYIMKAAQDLGMKFTPTIPLIQAEDVRFKLAKIAASAAGRTFSTDDGERLIVRKEHAEFAYNFLHHIYGKPSCGYAQLSTAERERATLRDPSLVLDCLQQVGDLFSDLVDGLLEQSQISARDMCDYSGVDIIQARNIISELVRLRAITKENTWYIKKPAFRAFLHHLKSQYDKNPNHVTAGDDDEEFVADLTADEE